MTIWSIMYGFNAVTLREMQQFHLHFWTLNLNLYFTVALPQHIHALLKYISYFFSLSILLDASTFQ